MNNLDVMKIENSLEDELKVRIYSLLDSILFFKQNIHFQEIMNNTQKEEIFSLLTDFLKICQEKVHINHWILVQSRLNILDNIPQDKTNLENNEIIANQCR